MPGRKCRYPPKPGMAGSGGKKASWYLHWQQLAESNAVRKENGTVWTQKLRRASTLGNLVGHWVIGEVTGVGLWAELIRSMFMLCSAEHECNRRTSIALHQRNARTRTAAILVAWQRRNLTRLGCDCSEKCSFSWLYGFRVSLEKWMFLCTCYRGAGKAL